MSELCSVSVILFGKNLIPIQTDFKKRSLLDKEMESRSCEVPAASRMEWDMFYKKQNCIAREHHLHA